MYQTRGFVVSDMTFNLSSVKYLENVQKNGVEEMEERRKDIDKEEGEKKWIKAKQINSLS